MMADYDASKESVSAFLLRRDRSLGILQSRLPAELTLIASGGVLLSPNVSEVNDLNRLTFSKDMPLPISMPLGAYADWMDTELNHLLYKRHFSLMFLSFERCILLYPPETVQKLLRIPHAVYQFGFHALAETKAVKCISALLENGATVLFGSGINTPEKLSTFDLDHYVASAKSHLDRSEIQQIFHHSHTFYRT